MQSYGLLDWDCPEISCWVYYWFYSQPAKLGFGHRRILASTGVQQDDPLGPLLFSLVLLQFLDSTSPSERCLLSLWYLDDGTFGIVLSLSSEFARCSNLTKSELYWFSGDCSFPGLPLTVKCIDLWVVARSCCLGTWSIFQLLFAY